MKIAIIIGTRPEIIKMAPVIRELKQQKIEFFILHTGQHYSYNLDKIFFKELKIPKPRYNLAVGSGSHAEETAKVMIGVEKILLAEKANLILVEGDTNSVLASALAATKIQFKVGHVEAGLRSYDRSMPEEVNRVLVDHLADYLFAPTENAKNNLIGEGILEKKIFVTGNTIVDAVLQHLNIAKKKSQILAQLNLNANDYFLITLHRQENVDENNRLKSIFRALELIHQKFHIPLICPIHPRTRRKIKEFGLKEPKGVNFIDPVGYFDFLLLEANASLILTDSGGVQEEACILMIPCITLRDNTERPETLEVGSNVLAGVNPRKILANAYRMLNVKKKWRNPFGDGVAGKKIVRIIKNLLSCKR